MRWQTFARIEDANPLRTFGFGQHGPAPDCGRAGHGIPSRGVVELTPHIRACWWRAVLKAQGITTPTSLRLRVRGEPFTLQVNTREQRFGAEWLFVCPRCGNPVRAVYFTPKPACRRCSRLIYLSQKYRPGSAVWALHMDILEIAFANPMYDLLRKAVQAQWQEIRAQVDIRSSVPVATPCRDG
jgi:DNA-directed RNA polymerase subunit RPC12/RpoP